MFVRANEAKIMGDYWSKQYYLALGCIKAVWGLIEKDENRAVVKRSFNER